MSIIKKCGLYGSDELVQVLDLGEHSLCDELIPMEIKPHVRSIL